MPLARRVADGGWDRVLDGDVFMLDGTHSIFGPEPPTEILVRRVAAFDVHPTAGGRGELRSAGAVAALEREVADSFADLAQGLEREGLGSRSAARCACARRPCRGMGNA